MNLLAAMVVSGLAGLGAEVVFTGLRSVSGYGFAKPWYAILYCAAPLVIRAIPVPLPWRIAVDLALLLAVDSAVRWREGEERAELWRALRWWWAWLAMAVVLEFVAR